LKRELRVDINHDGDGTYMHLCAMNYDSGILKLLIDYGADTQVKNDTGHTAFDIADLMVRTDRGDRLIRAGKIFHILEIYE